MVGARVVKRAVTITIASRKLMITPPRSENPASLDVTKAISTRHLATHPLPTSATTAPRTSARAALISTGRRTTGARVVLWVNTDPHSATPRENVSRAVWVSTEYGNKILARTTCVRIAPLAKRPLLLFVRPAPIAAADVGRVVT